jgi:HEAT repeat protein
MRSDAFPGFMETIKTTAVPVPAEQDFTETRKPTSLLIAQFFLFPLIIIGICVGVFLLFGYVTYQQSSPQEYLTAIRNGGGINDEKRWQAAFELSNVVASQKDKLRKSDFVHDVAAVYRNAREEDPRVRQFLALTMGNIGDNRAVPALIDGLNDEQVENRIYTLLALGLIGDNAAVPGVLAQLHDKDPAVRKVSAYVLGAIKDPSAVKDLQIALNDTTSEVRWNAAMALAQLNDAAGSDELVKLLDHTYVDQLQDMTGEQKTELMVNAVKCLALLKFEPARENIAAMSRSESNLTVRGAALEALKKF